MFEIPDFDREKLEEKFYDDIEKYAREYNKKEIAALLATEAEAAAHLYAWKVSTGYADYVRNQSQKRKEWWEL